MQLLFMERNKALFYTEWNKFDQRVFGHIIITSITMYNYLCHDQRADSGLGTVQDQLDHDYDNINATA